MTIDEYREKLKKLNDDKFNKFKEDFGGDLKTREEYVRNFVDNPKHERRICQLLKLKTEEEKITRATTRATIAAIISAVAIAASVVLSLYIWYQGEFTRKPIITIAESKCTGKLNSNDEVLKINLRIMFKNIGQHPADNFRMQVWAAPLNKPEYLVKTRDSTLPNVFYPENIFTWKPELSVSLEGKGERFKAKKDKIFFYVKLDYNDRFHKTRKYNNDIYLIYEIGSGSIGSATVEDKRIFQKYLDAIKY